MAVLVQQKPVRGCQTGDRAHAVVTKGKKMGTYRKRVAVGASGSVNLRSASGLIPGIAQRFCTRIQRTDDYEYPLTKIASEKGVAGMGQAKPNALSRPGLKARVSRATG